MSLRRKPRSRIVRHAAEEGCVFNGIEEMIVFEQVGEHTSTIRVFEFPAAHCHDGAFCAAEVALVASPEIVEDTYPCANKVIGVTVCGADCTSWNVVKRDCFWRRRRRGGRCHVRCGPRVPCAMVHVTVDVLKGG